MLEQDKQQKRRTATSLAYLSRIPRFTVSAPFPEPSHSVRRRACSSSLTSQLIVLFSVSITILSPSWTSAIGPPRRASGTTWPTHHLLYQLLDACAGQLARLRTDDKASGCTREAPVGDKRSRSRETRPYQRPRGTFCAQQRQPRLND